MNDTQDFTINSHILRVNRSKNELPKPDFEQCSCMGVVVKKSPQQVLFDEHPLRAKIA